jgi:hypothetical protein
VNTSVNKFGEGGAINMVKLEKQNDAVPAGVNRLVR